MKCSDSFILVTFEILKFSTENKLFFYFLPPGYISFKKIKMSENAECFFEIQTGTFFQISFMVLLLYSAD